MVHSASLVGSTRSHLNAGDGEERYLETRAAWLYYNSGLKQADVARALGVSLNKANRLLASAQESGVVRVTIEGPIAGCVALEDKIRQRFGLRMVRIVPELTGTGSLFEAVGRATASVLARAIQDGRHRTIGIGKGACLDAAGSFIPSLHAPGLELVSLLGCAPFYYHAGSPDLLQALGERSGAGARLMPAPIYARSAADLTVVVRQPGVQAVLEAAHRVSFLLSEISSIEDAETVMVRSGVLRKTEVAQLRSMGAVSVFLGHFLDQRGQPVASGVNRRLVGLSCSAIAAREAVGVARGEQRSDSILSVLRSGLLKGLVTTEAAGRLLLAAV